MKRAIGCLLLLVGASLSGQDIDKIAELSCECAKEKDPSSMDKDKATMELGVCLLGATSDTGHTVDVSTDPDAWRKLGEKVGVKMAILCPDQIIAYTKQGVEDTSDEPQEVDLDGRVKSVDMDTFVTVVIKENSGKETKCLWLRYFPGSDDFTANPKSLVGKTVSIKYLEMECYLPSAKGYFSQKEIVSLVVH